MESRRSRDTGTALVPVATVDNMSVMVCCELAVCLSGLSGNKLRSFWQEVALMATEDGY